jgi:hypothetical protein
MTNNHTGLPAESIDSAISTIRTTIRTRLLARAIAAPPASPLLLEELHLAGQAHDVLELSAGLDQLAQLGEMDADLRARVDRLLASVGTVPGKEPITCSVSGDSVARLDALARVTKQHRAEVAAEALLMGLALLGAATGR